MSVKSLRNQLLAAIAMMLVATIALGSSTYAWFAMNTKVTATGMQVQAKTEGGIEIAYANANASSSTYATSATTGANTSSVLAPTSTKDTAAWYHASAEMGSSSTARNETYETLTINEQSITSQAYGKLGGVQATGAQPGDSNETNYYMHQTFNIRSTASTNLAKGLTVDSVSVAGATTTTKMSEALRVAVKLGDNVLFYDPVANDTTEYTVYSGHNGSGDSATRVVAGTVTCTEKDTATLLAATQNTEIPAKGTSNNGGVDVEIYIWFEGEDTELYSENFNADNLIVTVNFSATVA